MRIWRAMPVGAFSIKIRKSIRIAHQSDFLPDESSAALSRFDDQACADASCANTYLAHGSLFTHVTHRLQIGQPDTLGLVVGMTDVVARMRLFSTELTFPAHVKGPFFLKRFFCTKMAQTSCSAATVGSWPLCHGVQTKVFLSVYHTL